MAVATGTGRWEEEVMAVVVAVVAVMAVVVAVVAAAVVQWEVVAAAKGKSRERAEVG